MNPLVGNQNVPDPSQAPRTHEFFFYGTLCHPSILSRVLGRKCENLLFQDALLPDYTRHHVKDEDYPAVVGRHQTTELLERGDPGTIFLIEDYNTRGTLVKGLTYEDMHALDIFEGPEYSRVRLPVQTLTSPAFVSDLPEEILDPSLRRPLDNIEADRYVKSLQDSRPRIVDGDDNANVRTADDGEPQNEYIGQSGEGAEAKDRAEADKEERRIADAEAGNLYKDDDESKDGTSDRSSTSWVHVQVEDDKAKETALEIRQIEGARGVGLTEAWVYVWKDSLDKLEPAVWSFEQFLKDRAHLWLSLDTNEFDEVERARALKTMPGVDYDPSTTPDTDDEDGRESKIKGRTVEGKPDFGHNMLKYWGFAKDYVNLNHGSYGSPPKPVIDAMHKLSEQCESNPDLFMRRSWLPLLNGVRSQVAEMIGAEVEECVIVPNATHGINTIVNNIEWAEGDKIVIYSTTYGAVAQTAKYICDRHPKVDLEVVDVTFPCDHSEVLARTAEMIDKWNEPAKPHFSGQAKPAGKTAFERVRMVIVDQIASNPGVVYPWEDIVALCRKYGIISLVDAAHAIGQVKTNVKHSDPDFWIANCHKWLMRNQHLIRSTFPTSAGYESSRYPSPGHRPWRFDTQYEWTGTQDWMPFMSISAAIAFRKEIGGEDRIMDYCHTLAIEGGKRLRRRWGTIVMDLPQHSLTAAMVNVALPPVPDPKDVDEQFHQLKYFEEGFFEANCFAAAAWGQVVGQVLGSGVERVRLRD
ncbi:LOW QUALITY PROTEIN: hypothetical protein JCM24511_09085 [Saitozyma sp. JCM 24511]|nr:LOW QUALITY PROTEIN: hypothetical protein JCM24511_09085 [Saitozyma sp. JCM 24511]